MGTDREKLERWANFGGVWRVVAFDDRAATVAMCRCDGGEEVQRLTTQDHGLVTWLTRHLDSESTDERTATIATPPFERRRDGDDPAP